MDKVVVWSEDTPRDVTKGLLSVTSLPSDQTLVHTAVSQVSVTECPPRDAPEIVRELLHCLSLGYTVRDGASLGGTLQTSLRPARHVQIRLTADHLTGFKTQIGELTPTPRLWVS